jgi:subtilisin-like proprotein convertase family protein
LGHCQPVIDKKYNCSEGTIELSANVNYIFTGQTDPQVVLWSTGQTAHKILVTPPGTWSWDPSFTGCEVFHYNTVFTADSSVFFAPASPQLLEPASGATGEHIHTKFIWSKIHNADEYRLEVARAPSFSPASLVTAQTLTDTCIILSPAIADRTVYYWRVKALNGCGESSFSSIFSFQTGQAQCNQVFNSTDVPANFPQDWSGVYDAVSELDVPLHRDLIDVNVSVVFKHPRVGYLSAKLLSPTQDTILLFHRPGEPGTVGGCINADGNLTFDQQATQPASALESQCLPTPPALNGTFKPVESLADLNGKNAQGLWKMILTDHNAGQDTGAIQSWKLTLCLAAAIPPAIFLSNIPLYVVTGESDTISQQHLELDLADAPSTGVYTLTTLPQHGTLFLNGVPMIFGTQFTQLDINLGHLVYEHNGNAATADAFRFDAQDNITKAWLYDQEYQIIILPEEFVATSVISQPIICPGDEAEITVLANGFGGIYTYSLNGGPVQNSNVFGGLSEGTYVVTVTSQSGIAITTLPVTIVAPPDMVIHPTIVCDHFSIEVIGGTPPLQFSLDGGPFQMENQFIDLPNGNYDLMVQDSNGCAVSDTVAVVYIPLLGLSSEIVAPKCTGNQNGVITVLPQGGQMPFVFTRNGGMGQSSGVFNNLSAGIYSFFVTDNQGCTASADVQMVDPAPIQVTTNLSWNNLSIQASGGTGTLMYSVNGTQFQADSQFLNLPNGNYVVWVRDENACSISTPVTVNVLLGSIQGAASICIGNLLSITVNASGGVPPYMYQLNGGAFQSDHVFSNLGAGIYTVVVRDSENTEITLAPFECLETPNPEVTVSVVCKAAMLSISGGTPPYTSNPSAGQLSYLPNGMYVVTVTDKNGCTAQTSFEIDAPTITTTTETVDVLCYGDSTGSATIEAMGGIPPYLYSYSFGGDFVTTNTIDSLPGGWHYYAVKDSGGCVEEFWVEILQPDSFGLHTIVMGNSILATASGGTGSHTYRLNNGPEQNSGLFEDLALGNYFVAAKDEASCEVMTENLAIVTVGTVEQVATWGTVVWPNPGNGLFRLMLQNAPAEIRAEVYATTGQLLQYQALKSFNGRVDTALHLEFFPEATYLLRLTDGKSSEHIFLRKVNR